MLAFLPCRGALSQVFQGLVLFLALLAWPGIADANPQPFDKWLEGVKDEASKKGISASTLAAAFKDAAPIKRVIELDRKQPESTMTFTDYVTRVVPARRVAMGRDMMAQNRELLERIGSKYGVQPRFIVALWGIETDFGRITGGFSVINALATLAYDGRRSQFFRDQLFHALKILEQGHISADEMKGSWAGAMGQSQFMPSSFNAYAVDESGDGRKDIWGTREDVFGSIANYLARVGWRDDLTWGREVVLPDGFDPSLVSMDIKKPLSEWQALGVRKVGGGDLPGREVEGSLVRPGRTQGPYYMAYENYRNILKWNRSNYFAVAVGTLADAIGD